MSPVHANRRRVPRALVGVGGLLLVVGLGPRVPLDTAVEPVSIPGSGVEGVAEYVSRRESAFRDIVPGAEKRIEWADSAGPEATPLSLVYLHGFSATRQEVAPLPQRLARELGANLFLARLTGHGRGSAPMAEATVNAWLQDGAEAMAVGTRIGETAVLMATSTGGTLALWLATRPEWRDRVAAILLVSPNLGVKDPRSKVLAWPWGGLIARIAQGPEHVWEPRNALQERYWTTRYPVEALLPMAGLVRLVDGVDLSQLRVPVFVAYSPRDQVVDPEVTVDRMRTAGGPVELFPVDVPDGGETHVLAGDIVAPGGTEPLLQAMTAFLRDAGVAGSDRD